jgi:hypothetical protein
MLFERQQRRDRDRRRGAAADRLQHQRERRHIDRLQLVGNGEADRLAGDDQGCCKAAAIGEAERSVLDQRALTEERDQLLGIFLAESGQRRLPAPPARITGMTGGTGRTVWRGFCSLDTFVPSIWMRARV